MAWSDFWEMLDGRIWWELKKTGAPEKREYTPEQIARDKEWLNKRAKQAGWISDGS